MSTPSQPPALSNEDAIRRLIGAAELALQSGVFKTFEQADLVSEARAHFLKPVAAAASATPTPPARNDKGKEPAK